LKRLLDSIFEGFEDYPYEIIIADGGSTDGTLEYLRSLDKVTLIEQGELTGAVKAFNICFRLAKYDYVFWPADDFLLVPRVLIKACKLMDNHKDIALVAPKMQEPTFSNLPNVGVYINYLVLSKTHIFRASVLRETNYFDENFRTYIVDTDSCLSALNKGYAIAFTREVGVIHYRLQDEIRAINKTITKENIKERQYYKEKWALLNSKLDEYISSSSVKKFKSIFFQTLCQYWYQYIYKGRLARPVVEKSHVFVAPLYDWLLEQYAAFKAEEYQHLKDFYLIQKLPKEVLS